MTKFAERLIQLKNERNLLQKDIAAALGLSLRTYQYYEKGQMEPTLSNIIKLSQFFHVSSDWLLGLSDDRINNEEAAAMEEPQVI